MVFMEDSERAASLAMQNNVDAGLHLNFTLPYSMPLCSSRLANHQERLSHFLTSHRRAQVLYHPGLANSFEYVVKAQQQEYERLYGAPANRLDGHHHLHLCSNVLFQKLLPRGTIVRRNLTFRKGEKGCLNRFYRGVQDRLLVRRHRLTDLFYDLLPLDPRRRLQTIFELGSRFSVEVETHTINDEEYGFLIGRGLMSCVGEGKVANGYVLRPVRPVRAFV
jgi:hypothetical protein